MLPKHTDDKGIEIKALNRRELMKRTLQLGTAAYVAPMILANETPVGAQVSATCIGATCETFTNCQGNVNCYCFSLADGSGFCGIGASCGSFCSLASPCAGGFVCQVNTCCGAAGVCIPASTACNIAGALPVVLPPGPSTIKA